MALPNNDPIYSRRGSITRAVILKLAANDYTGVHANNQEVFAADATNGSFLQRLRFKALGANVATVARIFLNNGSPNENWATASAAPTGTPSGSGGTILTGTYYGLVIAIDAYGQQSVIGAVSTGVAVTGPTGSISWSWTAVAGAVSYRLYVGNVATQGTQDRYFTSATNSYSQTTMHYGGQYDDPQVGNSKFYGEVSLPLISAASATAGYADIDYPMNIALPPGWEVYAGLGTAVATGWSVVPIAGDY
jgi:hypothetical protein